MAAPRGASNPLSEIALAGFVIIAILIFNLSRFGLCLWHFDETKANILSIFFRNVNDTDENNANQNIF